jgi:hypothetical protein
MLRPIVSVWLPFGIASLCAVVLLAASGGRLRAGQDLASSRAAGPVAEWVSEVSREVEALRGWTFATPVHVVRVSEDEARADWARAFDAGCSQVYVARREAAMRMTGLIAVVRLKAKCS